MAKKTTETIRYLGECVAAFCGSDETGGCPPLLERIVGNTKLRGSALDLAFEFAPFARFVGQQWPDQDSPQQRQARDLITALLADLRRRDTVADAQSADKRNRSRA